MDKYKVGQTESPSVHGLAASPTHTDISIWYSSYIRAISGQNGCTCCKETRLNILEWHMLHAIALQFQHQRPVDTERTFKF